MLNTTNATDDAHGRYVPAAGRRGFTRFYDAANSLTMREARWRPSLVDRAIMNLPQEGVVVDVGTGTGALAMLLARARLDAMVVGVDGDAEALNLARRKAGADRVSWRAGLAHELPVEDNSADAVVMSLLLHHLARPEKLRALTEARRVLRPEGHLHIADWGTPAGPGARAGFFALQLLDGFDGTRDHAAGLVPGLVSRVGFTPPTRWGRVRTVWGSLELMHSRNT